MPTRAERARPAQLTNCSFLINSSLSCLRRIFPTFVLVGPRAGQKLFTLQTSPPRQSDGDGARDARGAAQAGGFSLHAGVEVEPERRDTLERLCRYVSRPPVAEDRLALTASGHVRYRLKTPYRDGTTHIVLEPLDLMARLAALVPPARMHLTRYHGVLAPHSRLRAAVTPAHRGVGSAAGREPSTERAAERTSALPARHAAMTWARRLKRVFGVEIDRCAGCGGRLRILASIEEPAAIARILSHLERTAPEQYGEAPLPVGARGPPVQDRLL